MKSLVQWFMVLLALLPLILTAQIEKFTNLRGMEDGQGNTHLFYRHYTEFDQYNWYADWVHLDVANSLEAVFHHDYSRLIFDLQIRKMLDFDFLDYDVNKHIKYILHVETDPTIYIDRYDAATVLNWLGGEGNLAISRQDTNIVYATPYLLKSVDGGYTWPDPALIPYDYFLLDISPYDDQIVFASYYGEDLAKSIDGGVTFTIVDSSAHWRNNYDKSFRFNFDADSSHIYATVSHLTEHWVYRSGNQGDSWERLFSTPEPAKIYSDAAKPGHVYLMYGKKIMRSTNAGDIFHTIWELDCPLVGLYKKPGNGPLYAATEFRIYEITPRDTMVIKSLSPTAIEPAAEKIIRNFELKQNYPNPFNPSTTIEYVLPTTTEVMLTIYNIAGQKVATFPLGKQAAGNRKFTFSGERLPSGVYIYTVQAGNFFQSRKMALMR